MISTNVWSTSCKVLEIEWYKTYTKVLNVSWDTETFTCPSFESKVAQAFYDLHHMDFKSNSDGFKPDFWNYVKTHIKNVKYNKECTALAMGGNGVITFCPAFAKDSREDRASTIIHETRHSDLGAPRHVTCVGGHYSGKNGACDETFHNGALEGSGFNADIYFYGWALARKDNTLSKSVMRGHIRGILPDRFNKIKTQEIKKWRNQ